MTTTSVSRDASTTTLARWFFIASAAVLGLAILTALIAGAVYQRYAGLGAQVINPNDHHLATVSFGWLRDSAVGGPVIALILLLCGVDELREIRTVTFDSAPR